MNEINIIIINKVIKGIWLVVVVVAAVDRSPELAGVVAV
jgi:hypothetical protein